MLFKRYEFLLYFLYYCCHWKIYI